MGVDEELHWALFIAILERDSLVAFAWTSGLFNVSKPTIYAG